MDINTQFEQYYEGIRDYIKKHGKLVRRAQSDWGADVYELKNIRVSETDVGYGSKIGSSSFGYWGDYRGSIRKYSINAYDGHLDDAEKKKHIKVLMKVWAFLSNPHSVSNWDETLPDSFWLEKFKQDYPESHILSVEKAVKYDKL
jgi:hypothetical protein